MNELNLTIDTINPAVLWGSNNDHFELLKKQYPKLKIIARGSEVKVLGDENEIKNFEDKLNQLVAYVEKFQNLNLNDVERIAGTKGSLPLAAPETNGQEKPGTGEVIVFGTNGIMVKARTPNQQRMVNSITKNDIVFAIGPAGTGKTYTAVALAVRALKNKEIKRIILTRPAVEAGENLGFLPGDLKIAPLAFMRGRTLDNCFVILDEAQNTTDMQLKMFLTRMGPTAKFIVTGDVTQIDLPRKQQSGLHMALRILPDIKGIDIIYLTGDDVVRHKLVRRILEAYGDIQ